MTGTEIQINVTFITLLFLDSDPCFFVPQVEILDPKSKFLWLSTPRPITGGVGPILPHQQSWTRDETLSPDWLRIGTDIIGSSTFNAAFSLTGDLITATTPEPATMLLFSTGLAAGLVVIGKKKTV